MKKKFEIIEQGRALDDVKMGLVVGGACSSLCRDVLLTCLTTHTTYCGPSSSSLAIYKNCTIVINSKESCQRTYCSGYQQEIVDC